MRPSRPMVVIRFGNGSMLGQPFDRPEEVPEIIARLSPLLPPFAEWYVSPTGSWD